MTAIKRGTIQMDSFALAALSSLILIASLNPEVPFAVIGT
jgi:hypothetical protein